MKILDGGKRPQRYIKKFNNYTLVSLKLYFVAKNANFVKSPKKCIFVITN